MPKMPKTLDDLLAALQEAAAVTRADRKDFNCYAPRRIVMQPEHVDFLVAEVLKLQREPKGEVGDGSARLSRVPTPTVREGTKTFDTDGNLMPDDDEIVEAQNARRVVESLVSDADALRAEVARLKAERDEWKHLAAEIEESKDLAEVDRRKSDAETWRMVEEIVVACRIGGPEHPAWKTLAALRARLSGQRRRRREPTRALQGNHHRQGQRSARRRPSGANVDDARRA